MYNDVNIGSLCRHNPYFNRWFSAIKICEMLFECHNSHNPYFNRWFSAIKDMKL